MKHSAVIGSIIIGFFLCLGLIGGGYFIGQTMYNAKVAINIAEAKGLAERRVKADRAEWQIDYSVASANIGNVAGLYEDAKRSQRAIIQNLEEVGFDSDEIQIGVINKRYQEFRDENQRVVDQRFTLRGSISIETDKVDLVSTARSSVNELIAQGHNINNNNPSYRFTALNDIKPDMLSEAAQNARIAANRFAEDAGVNVGRIKEARQGAFIIRDVGSDYGDTQKIDKDVRVVTTIKFYLAD